MDRNSVTGLILIGLVLVVFTFINQPEREALQQQRAAEEKQKREAFVKDSLAKATGTVQQVAVPDPALSDSVQHALLNRQFGLFSDAATGVDTGFVLENDLLRMELASKGGYVRQVELKEYLTWEKKPLVLFSPDSTRMNIVLPSGNGFLNTADLYFNPVSGSSVAVSGNDSASFSLRAEAGDGRYIEYVYSLKGNSYLVNTEIRFTGLDNIVNLSGAPVVEWSMQGPRQEKNLENERLNTTIYYKDGKDEVDYLSEGSAEKIKTEDRVKWLAFKQQFFTSVVIAGESFEAAAELETRFASGDRHTKNFSARFQAPLQPGKKAIGLAFYYGPTHFKTLKAAGHDLQKQIPLGWGIFGWVNKFIVIPVFNFFDGYDLSYGIVILLLTLVIKLLLFPLQFRSYLSQARMRVLKPEVDELNAKYEKEEPLKKQQAVMELYRTAGVNPLGGCVPLLFQMPILFALFRFFPAAIELRQQSFLWADDLSTFDSVLTLPFHIPAYGSHVSLFALLMTISTILYTRMNNQLSGAGTQMMPGMKWMMYLMPVVFLFVLNSFAAGLNYYYFLANVITFGQQFAFQKLVDEKKIHAKIQENRKKPKVSRQSAFQKRLEEMAKQRSQQTRKNK